jgi:hypothetical protein
VEARLEALQAEHRALRERSGDAAKRAAELDDEVTTRPLSLGRARAFKKSFAAPSRGC